MPKRGPISLKRKQIQNVKETGVARCHYWIRARPPRSCYVFDLFRCFALLYQHNNHSLKLKKTHTINKLKSLVEKVMKRNFGRKEPAALPHRRINRLSNKSLQNYIEGSETDSIERGLQNQYQRWDYRDGIRLTISLKALKFSRRSRFSMF